MRKSTDPEENRKAALSADVDVTRQMSQDSGKRKPRLVETLTSPKKSARESRCQGDSGNLTLWRLKRRPPPGGGLRQVVFSVGKDLP